MTTETAVEVPAAPEAAAPAPAPAKESAPKKTRRPRTPKGNKEAKDADDTTAAASADEEQPQSEEEDNTHKVFVGNLAFATTDEELKQFCSPPGEVVKVEIITRGTRSKGYGFVSYNTEEEATKAVAELDKKELGGRQVNVELAKHREPGELKAGKAAARGGRGLRGFRGRGRGYFGRGGFRGRGRRVRPAGDRAEKRLDDEEVTEEAPAAGEEDAAAPGEEGAAQTARGRGRGRGRGRFAGRRRFPRGGRGAAKPTGEKTEPTGELSKTMLFVANLPFKVTDEDLKAIFKDYKVTQAHVVRLRSGRSKGFGFVEVDSPEEQQRVLSELKNVVVDSRELIVKVALANQTAPQDGQAEEAAAPAVAASE